MNDPIVWTPERLPLSALLPKKWKRNPRQSSKRTAESLVLSRTKFSQPFPILIDLNGDMIDGHQKTDSWANEYGKDLVVNVARADRAFSEQDKQEFTLLFHQAAFGQWNLDELVNNFDPAQLATFGFDQDALTQTRAEMAFLIEMLGEGEGEAQAGEEGDAEPQIDKAAELQAEWGTEVGQLWQIGEHRLLIGDCTVGENVARLMGGERANLIHADPPYGMGKEKDGIANDNLYGDKLDAFQMAWWRAARPCVEDNGSAYIWGNSEDLWRLWYKGGLADSERLTFRNVITWDKYIGNVKPTVIEMMRSYCKYREDCLFFMLGEQGFNNNSDNYWEGWEGMRGYLESEMKRCGWSVSDLNRITGTQMGSHWVTKSQWVLITKQHYKKIQEAAREHAAFKREHAAFMREHDELKREHDELKREFYSTRAYFDNTHDNMTDVWDFKRVTGEDRHGHATPKPVEMVKRAIKSSCPEGGLVYVPFAGTAPEFVAGENTGRKCYGMEISPAYGAVILQRMIDAFPDIDIHQVE